MRSNLYGAPGDAIGMDPLTYPCLDDTDYLESPRELLEAAFAAADEELEIDEHDIEAWASAILRETFKG